MIRVFIGTDGDIHQKAESVIRYSIDKNTNQELNPVDVQFIRPGWKNGVTGFTTHRYLIPKLCNYEGFAIYLDVDMIVLGDLSELWVYRTEGKWCTTSGSDDDVSVIDCSAFKDLPKEDFLKQHPGGARKVAVRSKIGNRYAPIIPSQWNVEDKVTKDAKLIHYTALGMQPWHPNPKQEYKPHKSQEAVDLFWDYYHEAKAAGY